MVLCTGRTVGDVLAKPSFKARVNTAPSRLDHILVDPELFPFVESCRVGPCRPDSDHRLFNAAARPLEPALQGQAVPAWVWDEAKREPHATALLGSSCQTALQQGCTAATSGSLCQADAHFHGALNTAAHLAGLRRTQPGNIRPTRPFR